MNTDQIHLDDLAAGVLVVMAVAALLLATPFGVGLSPDSLTYIGAAQNIEAGNGFLLPPANEPVAHLAPLYSFLLAALGMFVGGGPVQAARGLAGVLFGLNLLLIYGLTRRTVREFGSPARWLSVAITGFVAVARPMWEIHLMAWTEPMFLTLCLAALWLLGAYLEDGARRRLVGAGILVGAAILTRYAGLPVWASFAAGIALFSSQPVRRRIQDTALFSLVGLLPFVVWSGRNLLTAGTTTSRSILFHPITWDRAHEGLATVASWLLVPDGASGWIKLAVIGSLFLILASGATMWILRATDSGDSPPNVPLLSPTLELAALSSVVYSLFLVTSISLVDANTPLDQRILSPLFAFVLFPVTYGLASWQELRMNRMSIRILLIVLVGALAVGHLTMSYPLAAKSGQEGLGFNGLRWRDDDLIRVLRQEPAQGVLYSNSPDALYFFTGRGARKLPTPFFATTQSVNSAYREEVSQFSRALDQGGLLVYFELGPSAADRQTRELVRELRLVPRWTSSNGTIYSR